jgi:hypothetical protein
MMPDLPKPRFIPGVYNHCDRFCERCRFQTRCRVFRDTARYEQAIASGADLAEVGRLLAEEDREEEERSAPLTASQRLDREFLLDTIFDANRPLSPDDAAAFDQDERRREQLLDQDELWRASRECDNLALGLVNALRPVVEQRADPVVIAALETISWFSHMISVKTRRALHGLIDHSASGQHDDEWEAGSNSDALGTAKLVRLIIRETCDAWGVLLHAGLADGAPAGMITRLEALDGLMAARFPRAMAFVRAGLDES